MERGLTCVDLFSGCGGLSLGLKQAGFDVKLAVEKSPMAGETYFHNFVQPVGDSVEWNRYQASLSVEQKARSGLIVSPLEDVLASNDIISWLQGSNIDLVAGGPPCQGFSLAGRRNPRDVRNQLPWQFLSFVEKVRPKAVIIENVSGMRHAFSKKTAPSPFDELRTALAQTGPGYEVQPMLLNAMHYGVPQYRPRVFLVGILTTLAERLGLQVTRDTWDSETESAASGEFGFRPSLVPSKTHFGIGAFSPYLTVRDAISDLLDDGYDAKVAPSEYALEMRTDTRFLNAAGRLEADSRKPLNHAVRSHSPMVQERFRLYQFFRDVKIPPRVLSLSYDLTLSERNRLLLLHDALAKVEYPVVSSDGKVLARNRKELLLMIKRLATRKHSQKALSWHLPASTVMSLPDDFVLPHKPRIPTVRELARFQSFPDAFEFRAKATTGGAGRRFEVPQYTQVGNAVPPRLAKALGSQIRGLLELANKANDSMENAIAIA